MSFVDAQVRIAEMIQDVQLHLYMKRRFSRSWEQIHVVMKSLLSELDAWSAQSISQQGAGGFATPTNELQQITLKEQYYRMKILVTRPALRRVEQCLETGKDEANDLDHELAEICISPAQDVASLIPDNLDIPKMEMWWNCLHNGE